VFIAKLTIYHAILGRLYSSLDRASICVFRWVRPKFWGRPFLDHTLIICQSDIGSCYTLAEGVEALSHLSSFPNALILDDPCFNLVSYKPTRNPAGISTIKPGIGSETIPKPLSRL
jgi:hypothetical protein